MSSRQYQDCYKILGVKLDAEQKEIKENFYKLSKEYHPDLNKDESSLKKFKEVAEAYEILSNPEKRREYDSKMGFRKSSGSSSSSTKSAQYHYEDSSGTRIRYHGMKGEFRNGTFVDDEQFQEFRHIQYDLDPEKMEKVWKRYKARWERLDEIDRVKKLEERKIEFRKRMEMKRERMLQNLMSKEEKEEFMYKIRMHRPDACEDFHSADTNQEKEPVSGEGSTNNTGKSDTTSNRRNDSFKEKKYPDEDFDKATRNILKEKFGMSDEDLDRLDFGGTPLDNKKKSSKHPRGPEPNMDFKRDPFYAGMKDTSKDATSWKDFVKKAHQNSTERWEQLKNNRVDSVQTSKRYNIDKESNVGAKLVVFLVISAIYMGYSEFKYQNNTDKW